MRRTIQLSILNPQLQRHIVHSRLFYRPQWACANYASNYESIPRVTHPSIWNSIVPKFLRKSERSKNSAKSQNKKKEWNPATFYIIIYMLIGSNAINLIALRNDSTNFIRKADAQIAVLKEALERVHRGEDVDVESLLGTGDEEKEQEWAQRKSLVTKAVSYIDLLG